jgi:hypothetical protein
MKQKELTKALTDETIGSAFAAYLDTDYQTLVKGLGQPNDRTQPGEWMSYDKKVRVEWAFKLRKNGTAVITIYDYKESRPVQEITRWHIGKKGHIDVALFLKERFKNLKSGVSEYDTRLFTINQ